jgi:hypothetical protein
LQKLSYLDISRNQIKALKAWTLSPLTKLTTLGIYDNCIDGSVLDGTEDTFISKLNQGRKKNQKVCAADDTEDTANISTAEDKVEIEPMAETDGCFFHNIGTGSYLSYGPSYNDDTIKKTCTCTANGQYCLGSNRYPDSSRPNFYCGTNERCSGFPESYSCTSYTNSCGSDGETITINYHCTRPTLWGYDTSCSGPISGWSASCSIIDENGNSKTVSTSVGSCDPRSCSTDVWAGCYGDSVTISYYCSKQSGDTYYESCFATVDSYDEAYCNITDENGSSKQIW